MDMILPLLETGIITAGTSLWLALLLGAAFGFLLEQGGMGNALKISGQFYFRDLSVLKIMFSAIVTTALGLFWFARVGWLNYDLIYLLPTFIWPQVIGGAIFGAGFIIGGLCPGTSCVAAASGRIDGLVLLIGMFAGIFLFNELFALFAGFYHSSSLGQVALPEFLGISHSLVLLILVITALAIFRVAERIEQRTLQA